MAEHMQSTLLDLRIRAKPAYSALADFRSDGTPAKRGLQGGFEQVPCAECISGEGQEGQ